ncbi:ribonuclease P/MRP protein subunit POP6 [Saccharomyces eubayanus]|uniref:ribonuclease P/MRP protein subunit POP6 n=1 Tax=Saccharomyces eubayanus TaxID=1080349 RepID=UPI0006C2CE04|nr:POP6-like protein [Saccharomyces eubayanus]KOG99529.1 POP6-like protein [Saccharomyces eubayanus]
MIKGVYYGESNTNLDISSYTQCLLFLQESIIPPLTNNSDNGTLIQYHGISKNDNIKQSIDKLSKQITASAVNLEQQQHVLCVFSYGPHIQKMLSILEIFRKSYTKDHESLHQWNKLTSFDVIKEGRNELLEKKLKVPILITFVSGSNAMGLDLHGFTKQ